MGPVTIFDKSALQSFSMDESVWFDAFTMGNITPLFYVETLADLEKSVKNGKTPEEFVGMLAHKTPFHAVPNVHHERIIEAELMVGPSETGMDGTGRPVLAGGKPKKNADGTYSIHFDEFPEAAALSRWHNGEFDDIERNAAKQWRSSLQSQDNDSQISVVRNIFPTSLRISDLGQLKSAIDEFCDSNDIHVLRLALDTVGVPAQAQTKILDGWNKAGKPKLLELAPYMSHVFKVDLLYYLGIDRGFIGVRASNKVDMAYLYYLPFSMAFVSGDNLHQRTVPLFLREDQTFATASEMKAALKEFDGYFDSLPDEVKALGVMRIAGYPPTHLDNVITRMWDKSMRPDWREISEKEQKERLKPRVDETDGAFVKDINHIQDTAIDIEDDTQLPDPEEVQQMFLKRTMPVRKGKWRMISEDQQRVMDEADDEKA
ncbi:MAG TPA: hypothetical protein VJR27_00420 [Candidatus Saccharimonadales bacterium]|nr:hypothetical protein [Candidatus Saccharimonadales bacterium]